ncbi:citramalate synthase [Rubinisphaera sp.]|uniref:citramalate synthase n=1 Tax=Rubinisphaera sp. TaxID=2024857 RepID=UPI000C0CA0EA|nr:citramalate synthase [Rubinisphaera sp.]MBV11059.1 citramalate synthase [Rubinisphaera sp.]HCS50501.1 citramalate synthase [Planctomycetaceae bacterium]|tara:strand:+ start:8567 stop:10144 length:1578 start_codon:yes stop_codon:yes gene_type:complete
MSRIQIYDTTLRDGSQGEGVNFSLQDKLMITAKLDELGFDLIEGGFAQANQKDAEYFQHVQDMDLKHAQITAFGMTRKKEIAAEDDLGLIALRDAKTPVCTVVGKTWDLHVTEILRVDEAENLAMIRDSVAYLVAEGRRVIYDAEHYFDGYRHNPEFALKTIQAASEAGAELVCLCDTNGGTLPEGIAAAVKAAKAAIKAPLGIHCHNDSDVAVANTIRAIDEGAVQVQGTINGIGERCGNADLVSAIANLVLKKNYQALHEGSVEHLTELSRYVYELANMNFRSNQAFVGSSAFAHKGGMHVHAVNRLASSYEHITPEVVGNNRKILVSELSGRSNIIAKTTKYNLNQDAELMKAILARVEELEYAGYQFEAAEASFDLLIKKVAKTYEPKFARLHYRVNVETDPAHDPQTEATVKLKVNGNIEHVVAEGDGPVNALDNALRKALIPAYPALEKLQLVDYKVRVINSTGGTAAKVRVVIESKDNKEVWSTIGVSENIIEASWLALVDSVEYKLYKDDGEFEPAK